MGFSPDHKTLAVVSIGSNSVTFIDTAANAVKHTTYVGRSPHEAFFTPDGKEVWLTVRGEDYVSVLDGVTFQEKARIKTPNGPGMQIFSPDGSYGYVCSSFTPETVVISVADHQIVGRVKQESPFCPNIAATPDGLQRQAAIQSHQDPRHGPDHQPREFCPQCQRYVRVCDRRWRQRGESIPDRYLHAGREYSGRQASARHLALRRR